VQLAAAQALAQAHGVTVEWQHSDGMALGDWQGRCFDLILAIQVLPYVEDPAALLRLGRALLRPGGRLVASIDHPLRNCFVDVEVDELCPYPVRSYFDRADLTWNFAEGIAMQAHHQPLGQWIAWIVDAGLSLQNLVEAPAPEHVCNELWPEDSPLAPLRAIPHTAVLVARAPVA
jgi:SAM-dependent methyltransferase